jgi:ubiquinone/menaquinone biosynthesis C-methylase UbiE
MIKKKWEKFGEENPYYAVLTLDKFDNEKFSEKAREEFFRTGYEYIGRIWDEIETHFEKDFAPRTALDFGCGVGRLVIPIAERAERVVGIDISEKMLEKADENAVRLGFSNAEFYQTDEFFEKNDKTFDLIHSSIVFQHIKPSKGLEIFSKLVGVLSENGIGVIQFTYKDPSSKLDSLRFKLYRDFPVLHKLRNIIKRSRQSLFPMYEYNLNEVFEILQTNDCHKCYVRFSHHGMNGVVVFFQKKKSFIY